MSRYEPQWEQRALTCMQIAGSKCAVCSRPIVFELEGCGCEHCQTIFHKDCGSGVPLACPNSKRVWIDLQTTRVYAERCPTCGRNNAQRSASCSVCGTGTAWDNPALLSQERRASTSLAGGKRG